MAGPEHRYTILCVDDEPSVLEVLKKMLERRYTVRTAPSGAEALPILRERKIDVLITDQKMPQMTGIELVTAARAEGIDVAANQYPYTAGSNGLDACLPPWIREGGRQGSCSRCLYSVEVGGGHISGAHPHRLLLVHLPDGDAVRGVCRVPRAQAQGGGGCSGCSTHEEDPQQRRVKQL